MVGRRTSEMTVVRTSNEERTRVEKRERAGAPVPADRRKRNNGRARPRTRRRARRRERETASGVGATRTPSRERSNRVRRFRGLRRHQENMHRRHVRARKGVVVPSLGRGSGKKTREDDAGKNESRRNGPASRARRRTRKGRDVAANNGEKREAREAR